MTDLPRSRALVRLDGPHHIMPVEPVTPADSPAWRFLHRPRILAAAALSVLVVAAVAVRLIGRHYHAVVGETGVQYLSPVLAAAGVVAAYQAFARLVERRPSVDELGTPGAVRELGLGYAGGVAIPLASFAVLAATGHLRIAGFNPAATVLLPFVVQLCVAFVLEIVICGLVFRLVERWLGSWLTLLLTMLLFGALRLLGPDASGAKVLAVALQAGLLVAVPYMVTRRLWAAIGLHAGWRFAQIALYGDTAADGPHGLVLPIVTGPDWLTGGHAGKDASLLTLGIDVLLLAALIAVAVRRGRIVRPAWRRGRSV